MYQYDAIGNLIRDQHEGVHISWTPYGKVRQVRSRSDSLIVSFTYDAAGNRIEKKVVNQGTELTTVVTHYLRDASGNVMAIYQDSVMTEQPIYGSSRLGMYKGGKIAAHRNMGTKRYELNNHLGNVMTVITDNIGMDQDSVWASVVSASDYYPFGLGMKGRNFSDSTYRYGFSGMEKDNEIKGSGNSYDFGARIYDPRIGRWWSVDFLSDSYPNVAPYMYALNNPIFFIDADGDVVIDKDGNVVEMKVEGGKLVIANAQQIDSELVTLLQNTFQDSDVGKQTINTLNSDDLEFQVITYTKRAVFTGKDKNGNDVFGESLGFSSPISNSNFRIEIAAINVDDVSAGTEKSEDFLLFPIEADEPPISLTSLSQSEQKKILEDVRQVAARNQDLIQQQSDANLSQEENEAYKKQSIEDNTNKEQRSINTLIFEVNSVTVRGRRGNPNSKKSQELGETAGKKAVAKKSLEKANKTKK